ncbi:hypothetical protein ICN82_16335 [Mangrovicoccus sp. HB182678]|uniref:GP-PDE domain-containing protein n=2 Tax=Mangrovicoccus algicola TaxID=2771008 RepID=A0A8J6YXX3_9RHOB|nr:hypothetical protein [Mangrovicoccus algicola]
MFEDTLRREGPLICAERGLCSPACPENSLPALEAALAAGCDMAGLDLRFGREGEPVVFRDPDLARMTAARGPVCGMAAASLARLQLRGGTGGTAPLAPAYLPGLPEVLAAARDRCVLILTLPSTEGLGLLAVRLAAMGAAGQVALRARLADPRSVSGFVRRVGRHGLDPVPGLDLGRTGTERAVAALIAARPALVELNATPAQLARAVPPLRAAGIAVMARAARLCGRQDPDALWTALGDSGGQAVSSAEAGPLLRWRSDRVAA